MSKQQAEPVAWMVYTEDGKSVYVTDNPSDLKLGHRSLPLFTTAQQIKPLTDEEIHDCFQQSGTTKAETRRLIARAIERAHGINEL